MLANVGPKLLGQFGSRKGSSANNFGQQIVRLHRLHEGRTGFPFGFCSLSHAFVVNLPRKDCNNYFSIISLFPGLSVPGWNPPPPNGNDLLRQFLRGPNQRTSLTAVNQNKSFSGKALTTDGRDATDGELVASNPWHPCHPRLPFCGR